MSFEYIFEKYPFKTGFCLSFINVWDMFIVFYFMTSSTPSTQYICKNKYLHFLFEKPKNIRIAKDDIYIIKFGA